MIKKIVLFGDDIGIPQLINCIPSYLVDAVVTASIRPDIKGLDKTLNSAIPRFKQPLQESPEYPDFVKLIKSIKPDLIFVHSYSMYIPQEILDIPKNGAINVHFSLLPKYRGANPIQWAIINGETETGVTIHYMTDKIDAGDIIAQNKTSIEFDDTWTNVTNKCFYICGNLLRGKMHKILQGTNTRTPQDESQATRFPRRTPEDGEFLLTDPPINIYNKIRALVKPHPGAFYYDNAGVKNIIRHFVPYEEVERSTYSERDEKE